MDVVSEYPNSNLRDKHPVGIPQIYLEGDSEMPPIEQWNGVVKCTVEPPRDLFIPVLPYKFGGKLLFPLCRVCVETESQELCLHDDPADRQLTGTWCTPEIHLAIKKRYKITKIHELYQYPSTMQYNPETREDGLMSAYVRCFMALKIQASGWPPGCDTDEKKKQFVADVLKYDGIVIDPAKMKKKPCSPNSGKTDSEQFLG